MTEMTISVEEFDIYDIVDLPTTISFHLREFNVSTSPLLPPPPLQFPPLSTFTTLPLTSLHPQH